MSGARRRGSWMIAYVLAGIAAAISPWGNVGAGSLEPTSGPSSSGPTLGEAFDLAASIQGQQELFGSSLGSQADPRSALYVFFVGASQGSIKGDVTLQGLEGSSEVLGLAHEVSQPVDPRDPRPSGARTHQPLTLRMNFESSVLGLYQALATGETLTTVTLLWFRPEFSSRYFTTTLNGAFVKDISLVVVPRPGGFAHAVDVSLGYQKIIWRSDLAGTTFSDSTGTGP